MAQIVGLQPRVFALPQVERVDAHAVVLAHLGLRHLARGGLLQNPHDRLLAEPRLLMVPPLGGLILNCLLIRGADQHARVPQE